VSKRRSAIGSDPLDALLGVQSSPRPLPAGGRPRETRALKSAPGRQATGREPEPRQPKPPAPRDRKVRATFHVPAALVDEARSAVIALAGPPLRLTLAALVETALRRELERLRKAHHDGQPWPPSSAPLVGGRPIR
jgi:hypothetical protein